jgi:hypothetical protein
MKINSMKFFVGLLLTFSIFPLRNLAQSGSSLKETNLELSTKMDYNGWEAKLTDPLQLQATVYNPFLQQNVKSTLGKMALTSIDSYYQWSLFEKTYFTYDVKGRTLSKKAGEQVETWEYDDENLSYVHVSPIIGKTIYKFNQAGKIIELEIIKNGSTKTYYQYDSLLNLIEASLTTVDISGIIIYGQKDYYSYQNGSYMTSHAIYTKNNSNQEYKLASRNEYSYTPSNRPLSIIKLMGDQLDTIHTEIWEYIPYSTNQNDSLVTYKYKDFIYQKLSKTDISMYDSIGNQIEEHKFIYDIINNSWFEQSRSLQTYDSINLLALKYNYSRTKPDTTWTITKSTYFYDSLFQLSEVLSFLRVDTIWDTITQTIYSYVLSPLFTNIHVYSFKNGNKTTTFEQILHENGGASVTEYSEDYYSYAHYNTAYRNEDVILPSGYTHSSIGYMVSSAGQEYPQYGSHGSSFADFNYSTIWLLGQLETGIPLKLKAYPNPVSTMLTVETSEETTATLELFNSHGQMVGSFPIMQKATIPVQQLAKGIYFLRMVNNGISFGTSKFVKE